MRYSTLTKTVARFLLFSTASLNFIFVLFYYKSIILYPNRNRNPRSTHTVLLSTDKCIYPVAVAI